MTNERIDVNEMLTGATVTGVIVGRDNYPMIAMKTKTGKSVVVRGLRDPEDNGPGAMEIWEPPIGNRFIASFGGE